MAISWEVDKVEEGEVVSLRQKSRRRGTIQRVVPVGL